MPCTPKTEILKPSTPQCSHETGDLPCSRGSLWVELSALLFLRGTYVFKCFCAFSDIDTDVDTELHTYDPVSRSAMNAPPPPPPTLYHRGGEILACKKRIWGS